MLVDVKKQRRLPDFGIISSFRDFEFLSYRNLRDFAASLAMRTWWRWSTLARGSP